jgi:hypothetical protein
MTFSATEILQCHYGDCMMADKLPEAPSFDDVRVFTEGAFHVIENKTRGLCVQGITLEEARQRFLKSLAEAR